MKTTKMKKLILLCFIVIFSNIIKAQQIGNGWTVYTPDFAGLLNSGGYESYNPSNGVPDTSSPYQHLFVLRHSNQINNHQFQLGTNYAENDRLFFRKIAADLVPKSTAWNELATRGSNTFTGNQTINGSLTVNADISTGNLNGNNVLLGKGSNQYIFHTQDWLPNNPPKIFIAPKMDGTSDWNWNKSIIFDNSGSILVTGGNIGIGTTTPNAKLEVKGNSAIYSDFATYNGITANSSLPNGKEPTLNISENISGTLAYNVGGQITYRGGLSFGRGGPGIYSVNPNPAGSENYGEIRFHTTDWNGTNLCNYDRMVIKVDGKIGIGTTKPTDLLSVNGIIRAKEVKIDLCEDLADYVFSPDYSLLTLTAF